MMPGIAGGTSSASCAEPDVGAKATREAINAAMKYRAEILMLAFNRKAVAISRLHFDVQTERYKVDKPVLDFLLTRRSAPIAELAEPGPSAAEIETILQVATRVPDHGQLTPWRFILYRGESRVRVGKLLAELADDGRIERKRRHYRDADRLPPSRCWF